MTGTVKKKSKRIFYFDALRALAIISVIIFHTSLRTNGIAAWDYAPFPSFNWFMADFLTVCMMIGVDIFLMLSGALSLGRDWEIKPFLQKRLVRICLPFLFWGFVLSMVMFGIQYFFPDVLHVLPNLNIQNAVSFIIRAYNAHAFGFGPYWFFWMILGTYLIMPVLNKWLYNSDLKEAEYFLVFWLITCIFDGTLNMNFPIKLTYFTGPIGMVVLGYYLRHTKRKIFNNRNIAILFILIGVSCLMIWSYLRSSPGHIPRFSRYSIFMAINVTGIFLLFKTVDARGIKNRFIANPNGIFKKSVFSLAKFSYGFYLIHQPIMDIFIKILEYFNLFHGYKVLVVVIFLSTLAISWIIMCCLDRIPYINQLIGSK